MPSIKDSPKHKIAYLKWATLVLGSLLALDIAFNFVAEGLWFQEVDYLPVFWLRLATRLILGFLAFGGSLGFSWMNLALAQRLRLYEHKKERLELKPGLGLRWLLPLCLALGFLLGVQLLYQGQIAASHWQPRVTLYNPSPPVPLWIRPASIWSIAQQLNSHHWQIGLLAVGAIALIIRPQVLTIVAAILMSFGFGLVSSTQWPKVLPALSPTPFNQLDPQFEIDIKFYIFTLPALELLEFWLVGLFFFVLVSITLIYLLSDHSLSQGRFLGFSPAQQRHLYGLGGGLLLFTALSHWLNRYKLLYSTQGVVFGASYTDVTVDLPVNTGLSILSLALGLALLWRTVFWSISFRSLTEWSFALRTRKFAYLPPIPRRPPDVRLLVWGPLIYIMIAISGNIVTPHLVQWLVVQPNELVREKPYIERSIKLTREAFALSDIDVERFDPEGALTFQDLLANDLTVRNIRVWDTRPLLESNRQLQQIRLYYEFVDADVDRYTLFTDTGETERRQVLISARELNYDRVPPEAQTWVNKHFIYTHGYGFTMSPVNTASPSGLPEYFIKDIAHTPSSEAIRKSIPVGEPRIYFGELTNDFILTNTKLEELDFPSGDGNVNTIYQGRGGIPIGQFWRRPLFAWYLGDWKMLLTEEFTPQTRLLFRRNIKERVQAIAPFLRYDSDPYLVIADVNGDVNNGAEDPQPQTEEVNRQANAQSGKNHVYWMIDAYTTSDRFPYSDPGDNDFNYIRNSIKVVVDAYDGSVSFYIADDQDPIIQTWSKLFPGMFQPLKTMPPALRQHIRYPEDFFQVQSDQLMTYHMTEPQVFYNREDQWRAPTEIYANEAQLVKPYYLIMKLPAEETEEFILLRPFTPSQRNNLVAWLAARSDGDRYGRKLLYSFPKQELVFGPEQIEARINQDPSISQRISLWNTQGSRAVQGNLLVIPIEQSLLYIEPLYLEAEQNQVPTLVRVIAAYRNRIAMAETLEKAIAGIFQPPKNDEPPILRELIDSLLPGEFEPFEELQAIDQSGA
ncbi:MAG: UPF0182 family protein [Leptolyngbyaceae cyanobacterium MO_188.B28]|nr:UPF0182 family protein [Leptolyngbyaceae cyanobacterium MO_188.B28]